jgi:effector-binding domain-containing protein
MFTRKKNREELRFKLKGKKIEELIDEMLENDLEINSAPISDEHFIIDREKQISICIKNSSVKISNHSYLYEVSLPLKATEVLIRKIKEKVQQRSDEIKKELFKNEYDLIGKIKELYTNE